VVERLRSPPRLVAIATEFTGSPPRSTASALSERACELSDKHSWLDIVEVRDAGGILLRVRGELDLAGAPILSERLRRLRERGEPVVLDLDELEFIDMSGLRVLLAASDEASQDGWSFAVTRGSAQVRRLIALVRLDGQLPLDGDMR
jgi:anti-sigma B factor antagonist